MAFKIQPFYSQSPLQSSSPDRDLGPRDLERKKNRLERVEKRKEKASNSEKKNKRLSRREIILKDQIDRKKNGISKAADKKLTPLYDKRGKDGKKKHTHLKDNVGKVKKDDVVVNAYPGYRKTNVGTDKETTSVEEFNKNEDFPAVDKFNNNKVIKQ